MPLKTPNTTTAQIIAYLASIVSACVVLFKLDLTDAQQGAAIILLGAVVSLGHMVSDAVIRRGRSTVAAAHVIGSSLPVLAKVDTGGDA